MTRTQSEPRFFLVHAATPDTSIKTAKVFSIFDRKTGTDLSLTGEPIGSFTVSVHQEQTNGQRVIDPADIIF